MIIICIKDNIKDNTRDAGHKTHQKHYSLFLLANIFHAKSYNNLPDNSHPVLQQKERRSKSPILLY